MAEFDGVNHDFFAGFFRARFDHHDAVGCADNHDVHHALAHFVVGGIDDELSADLADAHRAQRSEERNVRKRQRAGCGVDAEHVRIIARIRRQNEGDDLGLAAETLGKHGTHRAINLAAGEHFALTHAAFAFDEAAGEASAGVGVFAVVNGEREEIDAFARVGIGGRGGEHNVIAHADHGRSMGLLGQFSGFE